jgi:hypothetical protein
MMIEPQTRTYNAWSVMGIYCQKTNADCGNCEMNKIFSFHKNAYTLNKRCHQPEANRILLEKGIGIPKDLSYLGRARQKHKPPALNAGAER